MNKNKVAIIIAAGSGIGADAAKNLSSKGFDIAILSSSGKGEKLAKELGGIGITGTNTSNEDIKKIINSATNKWGRVDVLINSAGHGPKGPILELTDEDWQKGMEIYFLNVVRSTRLVAPIMQKQKSGSIINLSSTTAFIADPGTLAYGSSKAAFSRATQSMASELGSYNIRVNAIAPSVTKTDMFEQMSVDARDKLINSSALKRAADPEEIAKVAVFLASELSSFVTGQVIRVDGGIF